MNVYYKVFLYYEQPAAGIDFKYDENTFAKYEDAYDNALQSPAYYFEIFKLELNKYNTISKTKVLDRRKWLPKWFIEFQNQKPT